MMKKVNRFFGGRHYNSPSQNKSLNKVGLPNSKQAKPEDYILG